MHSTRPVHSPLGVHTLENPAELSLRKVGSPLLSCLSQQPCGLPSNDYTELSQAAWSTGLPLPGAPQFLKVVEEVMFSRHSLQPKHHTFDQFEELGLTQEQRQRAPITLSELSVVIEGQSTRLLCQTTQQ